MAAPTKLANISNTHPCKVSYSLDSARAAVPAKAKKLEQETEVAKPSRRVSASLTSALATGATAPAPTEFPAESSLTSKWQLVRLTFGALAQMKEDTTKSKACKVSYSLASARKC
mmetsp:Transcript_39299/g.65212  ORF Transcript_39299/g.65212 Transcript_39299/m.65212 type:complete len:115 (+) Transcript_39299:63-407(+)